MTLPQGGGAAARATALDRSIFRVDSIPPPRISTKGDDDDIPIDIEPQVDSAPSDLRSLLGPPTPAPQGRRGARASDDVLLNLSGGLFGGSSALVTPLPSAALAPPVLDAVPPPPPQAPTGEPAARPAPPPIAAAPTPATPAGDELDIALEPTPGRRRLVFGSLIAAAAIAVVGAYFLAAGPGAAGPGAADTRSAGAGSDQRVASGPSASPGSGSDREPSLDDEPPSSATPPSAASSAPLVASASAPTSTGTPVTPAALSSRDPGPARPPPSTPTTPTTPPPPVTTTPPPPPPPAGGEFNKAAAIAALNGAAASAAASCKGDTTGGGKVSVTFAPSGRVTSAKLESGPFVGTPTGGCIARAFRGATVPPFDGGPVTVSKQVNIR